MAEMATKKSINVVSNKKSEVCNVQSNNDLIDLDDLTASNNQLISLCDDDDLVLTKNTHNALDGDDKSLQELIDSELALRICSSKSGDKVVTDNEESEEIVTRPETIKRIILDHRQNLVDVNAKFITAENEHCSFIEESCAHQNSYVCPNANDAVIKSELMFSRDEEKKQVFIKQSEIGYSSIIIQKTSDENDQISSCSEPVNNNDINNSKDSNVDYQIGIKEIVLSTNDTSSDTCDFVDDELTIQQESFLASMICPKDKYQQEEKLTRNVLDDTNLSQININEEKKKDVIVRVEETTKLADTKKKQQQNIRKHDVNINEMKTDDNKKKQDFFALPSSHVPLATSDEMEISDVSNICDTESREETTINSFNVSSSKSETKMKKKKTEDLAANSVTSPNLTRTKKTKKSKKGDLGKENISVNCSSQDSANMHTSVRRSHLEMINFSNEDDLSNVNVKSLFVHFISAFACRISLSVFFFLRMQTENYVSETNRSDQQRLCREQIATGISIKQLCRSFGNISNISNDDQMVVGIYAMEIEEVYANILPVQNGSAGKTGFISEHYIFQKVPISSNLAKHPPTKTKTSCAITSFCNFCLMPHLSISHNCLFYFLQKSSFSKFDALTKKPVLHVRSVDAGKVQQQLNCVGQNGDANTNCRSCGKVVFQMEQTKAEGLVWHKNCFRCVQCSKQLNVDNYESHESTLYCKPHFKELFQPKPVEESEQLIRPRKPELIIRENEPKELPPDVVRASDKPDLGLEELLSLNVKSRFEVFEKASTESTNEIEKSPSQIAVKRSPSILSKLANEPATGSSRKLNPKFKGSFRVRKVLINDRFQAKGMDIGVADESLNGIPYEESSESEDELKTEQTEDYSGSASRTYDHTHTIKAILSVKGKQGKMKEMYQQAVAGSDRVTKINAAEEIQHSTNHARSLKEKFERGEPIAASDDETDNKPKPEKADEEVIAAGISKKSRSHFLELDASAAKAGGPVAPIHPKPPTEIPRRVREAFMGRQVSDDMVRSSDITEEIHVETSEISNKFKFFESYKEPEKQRKQFRITPPRDGQVKMDSPDREIYRDPDVIRADDKKNEVVHTDTAKKMLSIFRQMEENACKEEVPEGPKPLKCFTPPPENKFAKATASDTEEDEDEDEESDDDKSIEERDPNYVRASDKVEDKFLKQAQNAARAKSLRAKFEHWKNTEDKIDSHHIEIEMAQSIGEQSSIESTSSLRARFESLGSQTNELPRTPKVKVNRFVVSIALH
ncbi:Xin actin-binding repeat-containing protein [Ooceraea biroi]|uniref:Xin actin-binding repeat-containing protein n=1 Tax=Ooceraea biroi TaxID=2015173 RepID=A0A026X480_OOCBI|nr:Xin actin-binding repeat-containing protein [Ooceraea biroi]